MPLDHPCLSELARCRADESIGQALVVALGVIMDHEIPNRGPQRLLSAATKSTTVRCHLKGQPPIAILALSLCRKLAHRNAQRLGHAFAVSRIGLQTIADVANLNLLRGIAHRAGGVLEESLLLFGRHQAEQQPALRVVVVVLAMFPVIGCLLTTTGNRDRNLPEYASGVEGLLCTKLRTTPLLSDRVARRGVERPTRPPDASAGALPATMPNGIISL